MYLYVKALHIIFVVTWFAGMFYIVRLFIYAAEANEMEGEKRNILLTQFKLMQRRLWYGITWPSSILTLIFGGWMFILYQNGNTEIQQWLSVKLIFVFLLYVYHFICHIIFKHQQADKFSISPQKLRIWNEVATLFLVGIVFLVVLKDSFKMIYGLAGLVAFTIVLLVAINMYKRLRKTE
ncbi:MAG: CopD family protein [Bacteroidetes bacterium]|nr:CopD family protein [Bacteroidota bacterium]